MTMGRVLTRLGEAPDLIFTSSAVRARETAVLAVDAGGWDCEMVEVEDLYGTSAGEALAVASTAPDEVERLMLVGHEPAWGYLVRALTGAEVSMKTATVAGSPTAIWPDCHRQPRRIHREPRRRAAYATGGRGRQGTVYGQTERP